MKALVFEAPRSGYGIEQVDEPITIGQLKELLEGLDDDMLFILSHDNGYTYGSVFLEADIRESKETEYGTEYETIDVIAY